MKWNLSVLSFLLAMMLAIGPAVVQAQAPADVTKETAEHRISDTTDTVEHPVRDSSIGCVTGAVLGTVVPGLGNAVGCVIGGFLGWWMS